MMLPKRKFTAVDLISGQEYRVIKTFNDYDGDSHPIGESWCFVSKNFLPYEDGLSLFVQKDGKHMSFRLQGRAETQGQIIDDFSSFVEEI